MVVSLLCHFNIDVIHRKNGARVLYRVAHSSVSIGFIGFIVVTHLIIIPKMT